MKEKSTSPFRVDGAKVPRAWLDANGHMNVAWYIASASDASFALLEALGVSQAYREKDCASFFTLETQIRYLREIREGYKLSFEGRVLDSNGKLFHALWLHYARDEAMSEEVYLAAVSEWIYGYVDLRTRRIEEYPSEIAERIEGIREDSAKLEPVAEQGRALGLRKRQG